jgi:hypothetical protein
MKTLDLERLRLPFTLTPLPGEPFGLWWHTYAAALEVTRSELAEAIGIHGGSAGPEHSASIGAGSGLRPDQVDSMFTTTRACPPDYVLRVWQPQPTTRFCPPCLSQDRAFQPEWRLPLTFHCLRHDRPLAIVCPHCGTAPTMTRTPPAPSTGCPQCAHDLATTATSDDHHATSRPVTGDVPVVAAAQQQITATFHRLRDHAASPPDRQSAQEDLTDITLLALHLTQASIGRLRFFTMTMPEAADFTEAVDLLNARPATGRDHHAGAEPDAGGPSMQQRLADLVVRRQRGSRPQGVPFSWRHASPSLSARIAHGRGQLLSPNDRLRYATTLPQPTARPRHSVDPALIRAARLPDQLWPVWALRLSNTEALGGNFFRSAAIAGLLLPHSQLTLRQICALLPHQPDSLHVAHQLRRLAATAGGETALQVLTELALALDESDVPIDYQRRRKLLTHTDLIDRATWNRLCRDNSLRGGLDRRLDQARRYLYELITGCSLTTAPQPFRLPEQGPRADHIEFCTAMPVGLVAAITAHAETFLTAAGITDEPLTWSPPADWVTTRQWPGVDPDLTDPTPLHEALAARWASGAGGGHWAPTNDIAAQLGISGHHMRYLLRRHPVPQAPYTLNRRGTIIAADLPDGLGHRAHPHPDHPQRVFLIAPAWLREEYTTWGRTLPNLAAEIGCQRQNLRNFIEYQGITVRPRSGGQNYIANTATTIHPAHLPDLLRRALTGRDARARLDRFLLITEFPSLNQAAQHLGLHQCILTTQLQALERACGGTLLQRNPPPRPIGPLTPLGQQLCQEARTHLEPIPTR